MVGHASDKLGFRVSPRVLAPLGLEQLQDPALAVLELVKNSWDADAKRVWINVNQKKGSAWISVRDDGIGMSRADFRDRWLVIGASYKRDREKSALARPFIGEKGLGRLASYALGNVLTIESASSARAGFSAEIRWGEFFQAKSVDDYEVIVRTATPKLGTKIIISDLRSPWTDKQTEFLATYTQFLTSIPGQVFKVFLRVDGVNYPLADPLETIAQVSEAEIEVNVGAAGTPEVIRCEVGGKDYTWAPFRDLKSEKLDPRLAGTKILLNFYRRDRAIRKLTDVLASNDVNAVLEQYQGVRIYKSGINVPPYGLYGDDWAALEKQRTSTGGPTMVPGNSQLTGEVRLPRGVKHLVVTAGRSGFSDQDAVGKLAEYLRWVVRELGTARRAYELKVKRGGAVPSRVGSTSKTRSERNGDDARSALADIAMEPAVRKDPALRRKIDDAKGAVEAVFQQNEMTLRLYAQLASTGIAAVSFAHELRTDFDVVSEAVREVATLKDAPDEELVKLLGSSWGRIRNFVSLFRLLPVKSRRVRSVMDRKAFRRSVEGVTQLVPVDRITVKSDVSDITASIVPAELDAILLNLVSNSVKAITDSPKSASGEIQISIRKQGKDLLVSVFDNGCGIPEKYRATIFEPLEGKFGEGTGMGLAIVRFIAERYKGSVEASAKPAGGYASQVDVMFRGVVA